VTCAALSGAAYCHDVGWNQLLRRHKVKILSNVEAMRDLRNIFGLNWKGKLHRHSKELLFFLIFTVLSAVGYLFHVGIYHVNFAIYRDFVYYRTSVVRREGKYNIMGHI
jgi:hypothetical protein